MMDWSSGGSAIERTGSRMGGGPGACGPGARVLAGGIARRLAAASPRPVGRGASHFVRIPAQRSDEGPPPAAPRRAAGAGACGRRAAMAGFTLIELMVVVAIIGLLSSIAIPSYLKTMIEGHVQEAVPYLQEIAARERAYYNRTGAYHASTDEGTLKTTLGVNLKDAANFCFVVNTNASGLLHFVSATDFAVGTAATDQLEVVAYLRKGAAVGTNDDIGTATCTPDAAKVPDTGWVLPSSAASAGTAGRAVILHYPPPVNGPNGTALSSIAGLDWNEGITTSNALRD